MDPGHVNALIFGPSLGIHVQLSNGYTDIGPYGFFFVNEHKSYFRPISKIVFYKYWISRDDTQVFIFLQFAVCLQRWIGIFETLIFRCSYIDNVTARGGGTVTHNGNMKYRVRIVHTDFRLGIFDFDSIRSTGTKIIAHSYENNIRRFLEPRRVSKSVFSPVRLQMTSYHRDVNTS